MTRNQLITLVVVVVIFVVLFVVLAVFRGVSPTPQTGGAEPQKPVNPNALPTVEGGTREIVKERVETPEEGEKPSTPLPVAIPDRVIYVEGTSGSGAFRTFTVKAEGGVYTPSTIVVNDRDVVIIVFTAVDREYNIFFPDFGVYKKAGQGESVRIEFQVTPFGEYKFFCKDCGQEMVGKLIVNKK